MSGYNIKFVEEPEKQPAPVWPKRIQILEQDFVEKSRELSKAAGRPITVRYELQTVDYHEKIFETYVTENPSSLRTTVSAVYRVKDKLDKEFYFWAGFKQCTTKLGHTEMFSWEQWGFHRSPKIGLQFNQERAQNEPKIIGYSNAYELPWNKDEVKKVIRFKFYSL
jgi:hypothetical protein